LSKVFDTTLARRQFGPAAADYAASDVHARGESLALLVERLQPVVGGLALDVGTGAGHTALALAPCVAAVVALDVTPEMLVQTRRLAAGRGIDHLVTVSGDAGALPFAESTFDLVTCRLAHHHFPDQHRAFRECARILRPGGRLGFTDNVTVTDPPAAKWYNAYERLRDPSHHRVHALPDLQAMIEHAGLRIESSVVLAKEFEFHAWADRQRVSPARKMQLLTMMRALPRALEPLFAPRWVDGTLYFSLWEAVIVARKVVE